MAAQSVIDQIERGREAAMAGSLVDPFIEDAIIRIQNEIVSDVRGGQVNTNKLLTQVGQMTALVMLRDAFESQVRQGDAAASKEYAHGT